MATIADLITRLEEQGWTLWTQRRPDAAAAHAASWPHLARSAARALTTVGGDPQVVATLDALTTLRVAREGDLSLTQLGLIYGAIADLLSSHRSGIERAGVTERARLAATLEATLHVAARATLHAGRVDGQPLGPPGPMLERLTQLTELAASLPPAARASALEHLGTRRTGVGTIEERVGEWAQIANTVLAGDAQLTGYAMQSSALIIATICSRAAQTIQALATDSAHSKLPEVAVTRLGEAESAWRRAAAWPEHIRLGGRSPELRRATMDVTGALASPAKTSAKYLMTLQDAAHLASGVGAAQARSMRSLSQRRQMWVAVGSLPAHYQALHDGVRRSQWVPEPANSTDSTRLAEMSRVAQGCMMHALPLLDAVVAGLLVPRTRDAPVPERRPQPMWETVAAPLPPHAERHHAPGMARPVIEPGRW